MTYKREDLMRNVLSPEIMDRVRKIIRNSKGIIFHENRAKAPIYRMAKINGEWKNMNDLEIELSEEDVVRIIAENIIDTLESEFTFKAFPPELDYPKSMLKGHSTKKVIIRKPIRKQTKKSKRV